MKKFIKLYIIEVTGKSPTAFLEKATEESMCSMLEIIADNIANNNEQLTMRFGVINCAEEKVKKHNCLQNVILQEIAKSVILR